MVKATIITIGDEILIGQIVDTNSVYIAKLLNKAGITVEEKISIGDNAEQIEQTLKRAHLKSQIVIITGGLGPTKDDITKYTLARIFNSDMRMDEAVGRHVKQMLEVRGIVYNELNQSQAMVPTKCEVLFNYHGTAPGMWFEGEERHITISLPGVPFEMEHLMEDEVMPRLMAHFALRANIHCTMITAGLPESMLAERIAPWEDALPPYIKLAYLPAPNVVRLRLSAYNVEDEEGVRAEIEALFGELNNIIPQHIVGFEEATMQALVHDILTSRKKSLSTAESCTGGAIASRFTAMAGASAYFQGGVVAYANEVKVNALGVESSDIERYGAVSETVARQMAEGVRRLTGSDYAIATTGIAGPTGGSDEKPVGTVWMAIATPEGTKATLRHCGTDRGQIINRATAYAIEMLYHHLKETNK
ncbi:MAG: competence/damage-inducible protein A [Alistipes sp.]|nr:competence/damage-inducible protein A [Alistipes sp.]